MENNEELMDEMKIVVGSKMARRLLSSLVSKAVNDKMPIGLNLDIDSLVVDTLPDGTFQFRLAAKGTANKDKIFDIIKNKGGV